MTIVDDSEDLARFGYRQELNRTLGSFSSFATECRSAARRGHDPNSASETIGLRVALTVA